MKSTPLPEEWKKEFKGYGLYRLVDKNTEYAHYELDLKKIESLITSFLSQTEARVRREVGERMEKLITCSHCGGSGQILATNLGVSECEYCGGDGHCLHEHEGERLEDIIDALTKGSRV